MATQFDITSGLDEYRTLLQATTPQPPPIEEQGEYLQAAVDGRMGEQEVRQHFEAVWTSVRGHLLHLFEVAADELERHAADLAAQGERLRALQRGRVLDFNTYSSEKVRWSAPAVIRVGVPAIQCLGLLFVGWFAAMATLAEASALYPVFDSFVMRATFSLLPALGICGGLKALGSWQGCASSRHAYWRAVTGLGLVAGVAWVVLFGVTLGEVAWEDSGGGFDAALLFGEPATEGSTGVWMVITGMLAETLLAAAAWRKFELELDGMCRFEVVQDPLTDVRNARVAKAAREASEARQLRSEFLGRIESEKHARTTYADERVAALTPRWTAPLARPIPIDDQAHDENRPGRPGDPENGMLIQPRKAG